MALVAVKTYRRCARCRVALYATKYGPVGEEILSPEHPLSPNHWCHMVSATRECVKLVPKLMDGTPNPDDIRIARRRGWYAIPELYVGVTIDGWS